MTALYCWSHMFGTAHRVGAGVGASDSGAGGSVTGAGVGKRVGTMLVTFGNGVGAAEGHLSGSLPTEAYMMTTTAEPIMTKKAAVFTRITFAAAL